MTDIIGYIITGACTIIAVVITNIIGNSRIQNDLKLNQAVTDQKIQELTREVREHNGFAHRVPILEAKVEQLEKELDKRNNQ